MKLTTTIVIAAALTLTGCASTPASTSCEDSGPIMKDFGYALGIAADTDDKAAGKKMLQARIVTATEKLEMIVQGEGNTEIGAALQAMSDALGVLGTNYSDSATIDFNMAVHDFDVLCGN